MPRKKKRNPSASSKVKGNKAAEVSEVTKPTKISNATQTTTTATSTAATTTTTPTTTASKATTTSNAKKVPDKESKKPGPTLESNPSFSDEDELNMNSAFVADIAKRKAKTSAICNTFSFSQTPYVLDLSDEDNNGELTEEDSQESTHSASKDTLKRDNQSPNKYLMSTSMDSDLTLNQRLLKSIEIGSHANELALNDEHSKAVDLFTVAIKLNPKDYRFYVNRSYSYDCLMEYDMALQDAETAISLNPKWPKCHYRKGRAFAGLKRFEEAEEAFRKVIELEGQSCKEARTELANVRLNALLQLGYDAQTAFDAAKRYSSVREAIYSVVNGLVNIPHKFNPVVGSNCDHCSSEEDEFLNANSNHPGLFDEQSSEVTNPFGWKALWVGNLSPNAKQQTIQRLFEKFGRLSHCGLYKRPEGAFALVHYNNAESPRRAMAEYQGTIVKGVTLNDTERMLLRFRPNRDQKKNKYQERLNIGECYYWRTTGCQRNEECHYVHILANKGVDYQPWMLHSQRNKK